ncbi:hypothetical protein HDV00_005862 [Rhizophlyctis rosea]|nr:hypothetical protein HDV00_005862 [Rhizophlyctis rosea]
MNVDTAAPTDGTAPTATETPVTTAVAGQGPAPADTAATTAAPVEQSAEAQATVAPSPSPSVDGAELKTLKAKILKQVEFYFSDSNLPKDKFLLNLVQTTPGGWVTIDTLCTFNRLKALTTDKSLIAAALRESHELLEVDQAGFKVRRATQIRPLGKVSDKSIYAKGFPVDLKNALEEVESFFSAFGPVQHIKLRRDADRKFKGSVFVEFKNITDCQNVRQMTLNFQGEPLIILFKMEYIRMKAKELEEKGVPKPMDTDQGPKEFVPLPQLDYLPKRENKPWEQRPARPLLPERPENSLLMWEGFGNMTVMEDVKALFYKFERVRWVTFRSEETSGCALMTLPGSADRILEELAKQQAAGFPSAESVKTEPGNITPPGAEVQAEASIKTETSATTPAAPEANGAAQVDAQGDTKIEDSAPTNGAAEPAIKAETTTIPTSITLPAPHGINEGTTVVRKPTEEEETAFWIEFEKNQASFRQKKDNRQGRNDSGGGGRGRGRGGYNRGGGDGERGRGRGGWKGRGGRGGFGKNGRSWESKRGREGDVPEVEMGEGSGNGKRKFDGEGESGAAKMAKVENPNGMNVE